MKLSKQQLRDIIKEELSRAIQEGELEEGFLDKLLGKGSTPQSISTEQEDVNEFVIDASNALKQLMRVAGKQGEQKLELMFDEMRRRIEALAQPLKKAAGQQIKSGEFKIGSKRQSAHTPGTARFRPGMVIEKNKQ